MAVLEFTIGGNKRQSVKLARLTKEMIPRVKRVINWATVRLSNLIKRSKLSGQVLNVITGRLRSSWQPYPAVYIHGKGVSGRVGSNVAYAAAHEFGVNQIVRRRAHIRRVGEVVTSSRSGGSIWDATYVREHLARMNLPARPYVEPSFNEERKPIVDRLARELDKPLQ